MTGATGPSNVIVRYRAGNGLTALSDSFLTPVVTIPSIPAGSYLLIASAVAENGGASEDVVRCYITAPGTAGQPGSTLPWIFARTGDAGGSSQATPITVIVAATSTSAFGATFGCTHDQLTPGQTVGQATFAAIRTGALDVAVGAP